MRKSKEIMLSLLLGYDWNYKQNKHAYQKKKKKLKTCNLNFYINIFLFSFASLQSYFPAFPTNLSMRTRNSSVKPSFLKKNFALKRSIAV